MTTSLSDVYLKYSNPDKSGILFKVTERFSCSPFAVTSWRTKKRQRETDFWRETAYFSVLTGFNCWVHFIYEDEPSADNSALCKNFVNNDHWMNHNGDSGISWGIFYENGMAFVTLE